MLLDDANIIRQKRKTLKITISNSGQLSIYSPLKLSYARIEELLKSKEKLIQKKIKARKDNASKYEEILSKNKILLLGKEYYVIPTKKIGKGYFTEDSFLIPQKYIDTNRKNYFIKKNLRDIANKVLTNRVNDIIENHSQYKVKQILIGNFKAKWGSCDSDGTIKFNWKMVMLNSKLIDFIVFHELTHLKELNHSKKFYDDLKKVVPDHKECRKSLKTYSFLLTLY